MCRRKTVVLLLLLGLTLTSCYTEPVRHLAADVSLVKLGSSTQEDVLVYLGDPDEVAEQPGGVVKWLYKQTDKTLMEKTPFIGKHLGSPEFIEVVITFTNGIVSDAVYQSRDEDDMDWADDYSWQEKEE
jgi:hypothetical protein